MTEIAVSCTVPLLDNLRRLLDCGLEMLRVKLSASERRSTDSNDAGSGNWLHFRPVVLLGENADFGHQALRTALDAISSHLRIRTSHHHSIRILQKKAFLKMFSTGKNSVTLNRNGARFWAFVRSFPTLTLPLF